MKTYLLIDTSSTTYRHTRLVLVVIFLVGNLFVSDQILADPPDRNLEQNRAVLQRWYDQMWGRTDFDLIPEIAAPEYLRHDMTGANNLMPAEAYRDMLKPMLGHVGVQEFSYYLACEGDYLGALGRYILQGGVQWDWVQVFRIENGKLAETWLTGMGGSNPMGFPHPRNAWVTGNEIPKTQLPVTPNKQAVLDWLESLTDSQTHAQVFANKVRIHDLLNADRSVSSKQYDQEMRGLLNGRTVSDFKHFLIEENNVVFAVSSWKLNDGSQWDWVQAFQFSNGKIIRTWLPTIGGTDASLKMGPETRWAVNAMPEESIVLPAVSK